MTVSQRNDVKDFVDLYYLLEMFSLWDLISGARQKFHTDIEPLLLASDFLKIEEFTVLPKMIIPLELNTLKEYFRDKAKQIGLTATER